MAAAIDRNLFRQLHNAGLSGVEIAEALNTTETTVYRIRKQLGLVTSAVRMTPERKAKIQEALDEGQSWMEIQRTFGVRHDTMKRHFPGTQWTLAQSVDHAAAVNSMRQQLFQANYAQDNQQRRKRA